MKSLKKRIISVCSAMVLFIVSIVAGVPSQTVFATQDRSANFDKSYSLTGVYAQDMVNIARAQLGKSGSDLGYSEHWCANFATDCARLTGMSDQIIPYNYSSRGRVIDLFKYMINNCSTSYVKNGNSVVSQPQVGDLLFTDTSGKYNIENLHHVAIVVAYDASTGKITHIGGNQGDGYITTTHVTQVQQYTLNNANVAFILRPNYVDRPIIEPKIEITGENYPSNPHTPGNNFGIEGIITSNNKLDRVWGGVYSADGTKIQYYDYNPNSWTVDLHGTFNNNIIFDNLPIGSYTYKIEARDITGYSKLLFDPYSFTVGEIPKPSNVKLSIPKTEYMKGDKIVFTPSGTNVTGGYTIGIDDASGNRLITQTFAVGSTYSTSALAAGNYSAYVTAYNDSGYTDSGRIYFSVGVTATFNASGGSCGTASKRVVNGDKYGDLPKPTRTGYTFVGWYTSDSGGSQVTSSTVVTSGANHTLYAHWTADNYTVVFNKNNGSDSMSNQSIARDQSVALTANAFTRTGYSFSSWNTKDDGSGTSYSNKASVKNLAAGGGSITLYAIWKPNTYIVKYDANTGSGTMDNSTITYDTAANLRKNAYTRTGYSFESWSDGNGNYYADQASVKNLATSGTVTLWVKWKPNTYKVTLDDGSGKTTTINVTYDSKYKISDPHGKDGYNFAGWYTEPDGKGTLISADTTVKITSNQTLYAYWSKVHYLISFNANGGTSELSQKRVSYDTKYGILPLAEKQGYEFGGWYLDEDLTQQITADSIVKITKNQEVYVKWVQIKLIMTFNPNDGTVDMETKKVVSGKVYGVLPEVEKDGFEFVGWFTEGGTEITSDSTSDSKIATVSGGTVTFVAEGTATITGKISVNGKDYTATYKATCKKPTISLSKGSHTMWIGDSVTLTASTDPGSQSVSWTSSNTGVATVSGGKVTGAGEGTATITGSITVNGKTYSATCSVTIKKPYLTLGSTSGSSKDDHVYYSSSTGGFYAGIFSLPSATATPSGSVSWSVASGNASINSGKLMINQPGTVVARASFSYGGKTYTADYTYTRTVTFYAGSPFTLRSGPSTSSSSLGSIPKGTSLTVASLDYSDSKYVWGKVTYNGKTGYVALWLKNRSETNGIITV